MNKSVIGAGQLLLTAIIRFDSKGGWVMSSHIAMSMMLALFPYLLFVVAMAGMLSQNIRPDALVELIIGSWPEAISRPIMSEMQAVLQNSNVRLMTSGGVLALYFASNGIDAVRLAMVRAYSKADERSYWRARLLCLAFVLVGGVVASIAAWFELALPAYQKFVGLTPPESVTNWFSGGGPLRVFTLFLPLLAVTACHLWLPRRRRPLLQLLPGIGLTMVLWFVTALGFSTYVSSFSNYSAIYAGLAGTMAALVFLYMLSAILILGAELNGALSDFREGEDTP